MDSVALPIWGRFLLKRWLRNLGQEEAATTKGHEKNICLSPTVSEEEAGASLLPPGSAAALQQARTGPAAAEEPG